MDCPKCGAQMKKSDRHTTTLYDEQRYICPSCKRVEVVDLKKKDGR